MATIYEEVEVTETRKREVGRTCDVCGNRIPVSLNIDSDFHFTTYIHHGFWVQTVGWELRDICPDCAEKMRGWLLAQGATLRNSDPDSDY